MKKKIFIILIVVALISFEVYIFINKKNNNNSSTTPNTTDNQNNTDTQNNNTNNTNNSDDNNQDNTTNSDSRQISYKCNYDSGWNEFNPKEAFGYYLGKYRETITYTFDITDNKYLYNTNYIAKYEFESIDGYSYFALQGDYDNDLDEANLTKTYSSKKLIVGSYNQDDSLDNYIKSLSNNNLSCNLNN